MSSAYTVEQCLKWRTNKLVNPITKRNIEFEKTTYNNFVKACKKHNIPLNDTPLPKVQKVKQTSPDITQVTSMVKTLSLSNNTNQQQPATYLKEIIALHKYKGMVQSRYHAPFLGSVLPLPAAQVLDDACVGCVKRVLSWTMYYSHQPEITLVDVQKMLTYYDSHNILLLHLADIVVDKEHPRHFIKDSTTLKIITPLLKAHNRTITKDAVSLLTCLIDNIVFETLFHAVVSETIKVYQIKRALGDIAEFFKDLKLLKVFFDLKYLDIDPEDVHSNCSSSDNETSLDSEPEEDE